MHALTCDILFQQKKNIFIVRVILVNNYNKVTLLMLNLNKIIYYFAGNSGIAKLYSKDIFLYCIVR